MRMLRSSGYKDQYEHTGETISIDMYNLAPPTSTGDYDYDPDTGEFIANAIKGDYNKVTVNVPIQESDNHFEKEFDTPDIYIARPGVMGGVLKLFVTVSTTMANLEAQAASDTNLIIDSDYIKKRISQPDMTCSFENDPVLFAGKRRTETISLFSNFRVSSSFRMRFRVTYKDSGIDDVQISSMLVLTDNLMFLFGENSAENPS